jgi:hypothetical protein
MFFLFPSSPLLILSFFFFFLFLSFWCFYPSSTAADFFSVSLSTYPPLCYKPLIATPPGLVGFLDIFFSKLDLASFVNSATPRVCSLCSPTLQLPVVGLLVQLCWPRAGTASLPPPPAYSTSAPVLLVNWVFCYVSFIALVYLLFYVVFRFSLPTLVLYYYWVETLFLAQFQFIFLLFALFVVHFM